MKRINDAMFESVLINGLLIGSAAVEGSDPNDFDFLVPPTFFRDCGIPFAQCAWGLSANYVCGDFDSFVGTWKPMNKSYVDSVIDTHFHPHLSIFTNKFEATYGITINLIVPNTQLEYMAWKFAAKTISNFAGSGSSNVPGEAHSIPDHLRNEKILDVMSDLKEHKEVRVAAYELLRHAFKEMMSPYTEHQ